MKRRNLLQAGIAAVAGLVSTVHGKQSGKPNHAADKHLGQIAPGQWKANWKHEKPPAPAPGQVWEEPVTWRDGPDRMYVLLRLLPQPGLKPEQWPWLCAQWDMFPQGLYPSDDILYDPQFIAKLMRHCWHYRGHIGDLAALARCTPYDPLFPAPDLSNCISDGFGSSISAWCPMCGGKTMQVVRPGKFQCTKCG